MSYDIMHVTYMYMLQVCLRGNKPGKAPAGPRRQDREIRKLRGELQRESEKFATMVAKYQRELLDVSAVSVLRLLILKVCLCWQGPLLSVYI